MKIFRHINSLFIEKLTTAQTLILGYITFGITGAVLLMLPVSAAGDESLGIIDSIFTSVSALSGTGLTVIDTATYFSFFGKTVILVLIQIGNIGYMLFFALAVILFGGRISIVNKMMIKESISKSTLDLKQFVIKVFKYTLIIEGIAAVLLSVYWMQYFDVITAIKQGVFHSVSAFCTAGFSLFSDNLIGFRNDYFISLTIIVTAFLGSIGFFVLYDLSHYIKSSLKFKRYRLSTHSRLVLIVSLSIIIIGTVFVFFADSLLEPPVSGESALTALFQSVSASSSVGFNSINIDAMKSSSKLFLMLEMFIGASPSGTGGGIKTTVFAIMLLSLFAFVRNKKYVNTYHRSIHPSVIAKAFSISLMAIIWLFLSLLVLTLTEEQVFLDLMFECISALGNNGISTGITPELSPVGKMLLSLSMLIGRVGPLIVGYTLIGKSKVLDYQLPQANILIV
jgi:trk system potassium uptake protein TrkH